MISTRLSGSPIIVVGMHRSGTSLAVKVLELCGVFMGSDQEYNNESRLFLSMNRWMFGQAGARWDTPTAFSALPEKGEFADSLVKELASATAFPGILRYLGPQGMLETPHRWGWKDPRNTYTAPWWLKLYPGAKLMIIRRHGVDVALSLSRRQMRQFVTNQQRHRGWRKALRRISQRPVALTTSPRCLDLAESFELWREYNSACDHLKASWQGDVLELQYESLLATPDTTARRICDWATLAQPDDSLEERLWSLVEGSRAYAYRHSPTARSFAASRSAELSEFGYRA